MTVEMRAKMCLTCREGMHKFYKSSKRKRKLCQREFQITSYQILSVADLIHYVIESQDIYQLESAFPSPVRNSRITYLSLIFEIFEKKNIQLERHRKLDDKLKINISSYFCS